MKRRSSMALTLGVALSLTMAGCAGSAPESANTPSHSDTTVEDVGTVVEQNQAIEEDPLGQNPVPRGRVGVNSDEAQDEYGSTLPGTILNVGQWATDETHSHRIRIAALDFSYPPVVAEVFDEPVVYRVTIEIEPLTEGDTRTINPSNGPLGLRYGIIDLDGTPSSTSSIAGLTAFKHITFGSPDCAPNEKVIATPGNPASTCVHVGAGADKNGIYVFRESLNQGNVYWEIPGEI